MTRDLDALLWATKTVGTTIFKYVPEGAHFVFNREDAERPHAILVRTKHGYRHLIGGRQWKTGARTAVHVLHGGHA